MSKIFYNVDQTARRLGISEREVAALIRSGQLTTITVGNRKVIPAGVVESWAKGTRASASGKAPVPGTKKSTDSAHTQISVKRHYSDVEVAQRLGKPYTEIYRMANLGQLPVTFIDGTRMFPKEAIDHLATQTTNVERKVTRTKNESSSVGNTVKGPKPTKHPQGPTRKAPVSRSSANDYFTLQQVAHALQRPEKAVRQMARFGEINTTVIAGQIWVSSSEMESVISRRQPSRQERIKGRLPRPGVLVARLHHAASEGATTTASQKYPEGAPDSSATIVQERVVMEAAQMLGTSLNKAKEMVAARELVLDQNSGRLIEAKREAELQSGQIPATIDYDVSGDGRRVQDSTIVPQSVQLSRTEPEGTIEQLEDEKRQIATELDRERTWHAKNLADAQHEIDQLDIQLENIRSTKDRTIEDLGADMEELELKVRDLEGELEQERERREEAEHTVRSLQRLQDEEHELPWESERGDDRSEQHTPGSQNPVRGFLETFGKSVRDALGPEESTDRSGQWDLAQLREELDREREAHENNRSKAQYDYARLENAYRNLDEQNRALKDEIDSIKSDVSGSPTREELEVKLDWNEARRRDLEKNLALEKQRARQLESGVRTLAEIRRLLAEGGPPSLEPPSLEPAKAVPTSGGTGREADASTSEVLRVHTRNGEWVFRPPFMLEPEEVELLRLVAGEDGITAEQIKRRTGRRRAVDDLDDLLDRLHAEGLEPIKESNDRYSFDPDLLQG